MGLEGQEAAVRRLKEYEMRKAGHDHEWVLLSGRTSAFLTSQSFFATGAAVLYSNNHSWSVLFLAVIALLLAFASSVSITINCRVLLDWHIFIQNLIISDTKDEYLKGFYMERGQPDLFHTVSVDIYHIGITVIGGLAWAFIIDTLIIFSNMGENRVALGMFAITATALAALVWAVIVWAILSKGSILRKSRVNSGV